VVRFPTRESDLSLLQSVSPILRSTQPSVQWVAGVKWPGFESVHSSPLNAWVKGEWSHTSAHLIKLSENKNDPPKIIHSL
jgi:hypothetical protein